jgi:hypothetical protein
MAMIYVEEFESLESQPNGYFIGGSVMRDWEVWMGYSPQKGLDIK